MGAFEAVCRSNPDPKLLCPVGLFLVDRLEVALARDSSSFFFNRRRSGFLEDSDEPLPPLLLVAVVVVGMAPTLREEDSLLDFDDLELFKNAAKEEIPESPKPRSSFRWGSFEREGGDKSSTPTLLASRGPTRGARSSSMESPDKLFLPSSFRRARTEPEVVDDDVVTVVADSLLDSVESRLDEVALLADATACAARAVVRLRAPLLLLRLRLELRGLLVELRPLSSVGLAMVDRVKLLLLLLLLLLSVVVDVAPVLLLVVLVGSMEVVSVESGNREVESSEDLDRAGAIRRERCTDRELPVSVWNEERLDDMIPNESLDRVARGTRRRALPRRDPASSGEPMSARLFSVKLAIDFELTGSSLECRVDLDTDEDDNGVLATDRRIRSRARTRLGSSNSLMSSSDAMEDREWEESPRWLRVRRGAVPVAALSDDELALSTVKADMDLSLIHI